MLRHDTPGAMTTGGRVITLREGDESTRQSFVELGLQPLSGPSDLDLLEAARLLAKTDNNQCNSDHEVADRSIEQILHIITN